MATAEYRPRCARVPACRYRQLARTAGFSLLELLIALTILAIALIPVAYFYSKSLQAVEEAGIRTRALMLAQERIAEVRQIPYSQLRSNITPSEDQLRLFAANGTIDTEALDWFGYDFETTPLQTQRGVGAAGQDIMKESRAMFFYPLPLYYNPYQPVTQGYNNALNINHYRPFNPIGGMLDEQLNFNNGGGSSDYEFEPIGFYTEKVLNQNRALSGSDLRNINMADNRTLPVVEPSLDSGNDAFRLGSEEQVEKYSIYGRRTIILDVLPYPLDTDPGLQSDPNRPAGLPGTGTPPDTFRADDDRDGAANAIYPYPLAKGPDNKFQVLSQYGARGKLIIVQVFWLPRNPANDYVPPQDLNKIELKTFVSATNSDSLSNQANGDLTRTDSLLITPPN